MSIKSVSQRWTMLGRWSGLSMPMCCRFRWENLWLGCSYLPNPIALRSIIRCSLSIVQFRCCTQLRLHHSERPSLWSDTSAKYYRSFHVCPRHRLIFVLAHPNPCQGVLKPQPLAFSDEGFILCDGERMFVESCPIGTVWNDKVKTCGWPEMESDTKEAPSDLAPPRGSRVTWNRSCINLDSSRTQTATRYSTQSNEDCASSGQSSVRSSTANLPTWNLS